MPRSSLPRSSPVRPRPRARTRALDPRRDLARLLPPALLLLVLALGACSPDTTVPAAVTPDRSWTWLNPLPHGIDLNGVWGARRGSIWAVGDLGVIMHFDGLRWRRVESPTGRDILAVDGCAEDEVWAVGEGGLVLSCDGRSWRRLPDLGGATLRAVRCAGPGDVWALAEDALWRGDGSAWEPVTGFAERMTELALQADGRPVVAGDGLRFWTGDEWLPAGTQNRYYDLALREGQLLAAGDDYAYEGWVERYRDLRLVEGYTMPGRPLAIAPLGDRLIVSIWRERASLYVSEISPCPEGICRGHTVWTSRERRLTDLCQPAGGPGLVAACGDHGTLLTCDESESTRVYSSGYLDEIEALHGDGEGGFFAAGAGALLRHDGAAVVAELATGRRVRALWAEGPRTAVAVGDAASLWRFDDGAWRPVTVGGDTALIDVWSGAGGEVVYAVGAPGGARRLVGSDWQPLDLPQGMHVRRIRGHGPDDVLAFGVVATADSLRLEVRRLEAGTWEPIHVGPRLLFPEALMDAWVDPDGPALAVLLVLSDGPAVLHHDGATWTLRPLPVLLGPFLEARLGGSGPDDLYVVGGAWQYQRFDGRTWRTGDYPDRIWINDVWGDPGGTVLFGGAGGAVLQRTRGRT